MLVSSYHRVGDGLAAPSSLFESLVAYALRPSGLNSNTVLADHGTIGSTYSLVYQRETEKVFTGAYLKRHSGLAEELGSIFVVDDAFGTPVASEYFSLDALGFSAGAIAPRGIGSDPAVPSYDTEAFGKIGKAGLGDIEMDRNGERIYMVNLFDNKLYVANINNPAKAVVVAGDITSFAITDPGCTNGTWRPFGLGLDRKRNVMYISGVCDASGVGATRADLHAYVYEFDIATQTMGVAPVLDFPLDFVRKRIKSTFPSVPAHFHWNPWTDDYSDFLHGPVAGTDRTYPQPMFTDVVVADNGDLVLGFRDRAGDQLGHNNYPPDVGLTDLVREYGSGDIYIAASDGAGGYTLENNGSVGVAPDPIRNGTGVGNADGPGGGEFFGQDNVNATHFNASLGGLAILCGTGEVEATSMDPRLTTVNAGGNRTYSWETGVKKREYQAYASGATGTSDYGKANGMGDVELMSPPAPLEVGNLVWSDTNSNGVQDATESGIAGIIVKLFKSDGVTLLGTATTDANGNYIFSNDPNGPAPGAGDSHVYQIAMLMRGNDYIVRIENASGGSQQAAIGVGNALIPASAGEGANGPINNTDGVASGTNADIVVAAASIPYSGANNHNFDFGFGPPPAMCSITVNTTMPSPCDGVTNNYTLAVNVTYANGAGDITISTNNGASQTFTPAGASGTETFTLTGIASDGTMGIDVSVVYLGDAGCNNTVAGAYNAPDACCPSPRCGTVSAVKN